jgi:hypothetical protein
MSGSTTNLDLLSSAASGKEAKVNALADAGSPSTLFGRREKTCNGLTWGYYGGVKLIKGVPTAFGNGTIGLTASTTNYLYETNGTCAVSTTLPTGWPGAMDGNQRALYEIVCGTSAVTSYVDWRTAGAGERAIPRVATMTYATPLTLDWDAYDVIKVTLAGPCTFNHSGGTDGSRKTLEVKQDGTGSRVATWGTGSRFGATIPSPTLTTTANKMDRLEFVKSSTNYDLVAINKGY